MIKKWKMKPNVNYKFATCYSMHEMFFKWFKKKSCPACGGKLMYTPREEYLGKQSLNDAVDGGIPGIRDTYMVYHEYTCEKCGKVYTLEELASKNS